MVVLDEEEPLTKSPDRLDGLFNRGQICDQVFTIDSLTALV
jgi:hypothetical protein